MGGEVSTKKTPVKPTLQIETGAANSTTTTTTRRTPVYTPKSAHTSLTFTPASAVRSSASMGGNHSDEKSSPLLTSQGNTNSHHHAHLESGSSSALLDPSLDLVLKQQGDNDDDDVDDALDVKHVTSPAKLLQFNKADAPALLTMRDEEYRVKRQGAQQDDEAGDVTAMQEDFEATQTTDATPGYGELEPPFDISHNESPPPSDLVTWIRNAYERAPSPHDDSAPRVLREDLYAHMARDLPPSATLPSKEQVANLVVQAFPGTTWQPHHIDQTPNHIIVGIQLKRSSPPLSAHSQQESAGGGGGGVRSHPDPSRSLAHQSGGGGGSRHRYTNSCNLSDLANIAAYAHREITQSTEARDSYSPPDSRLLSPTTTGNGGHGNGSTTFGTPGRRSALDELAAAAALSERSPMAKSRRISYGDDQQQDGGKTKRRRTQGGGKTASGAGKTAQAGSSREGGAGGGGGGGYDERSAASGPGGKKKSSRATGKSSRAKQSQTGAVNGVGSGGSSDTPATMYSHVVPASGGGGGGTDSTRTARGGTHSNRSKTASSGPKQKKNIYTAHYELSSTDPNVKHFKPNFTYHELITHEIKRSAEGRLQLSEIYRRISERYPYFKLGEPGWQNSIRHNLSLKKCFVRVDRPNDAAADKSGKGGWWTYVAQGDPDGRGGRKGLSGKGTGEYRKGQTPSDIASRSGSPDDERFSGRHELDAGGVGVDVATGGGGGGGGEDELMDIDQHSFELDHQHHHHHHHPHHHQGSEHDPLGVQGHEDATGGITRDMSLGRSSGGADTTTTTAAAAHGVNPATHIYLASTSANDYDVSVRGGGGGGPEDDDVTGDGPGDREGADASGGGYMDSSLAMAAQVLHDYRQEAAPPLPPPSAPVETFQRT